MGTTTGIKSMTAAGVIKLFDSLTMLIETYEDTSDSKHKFQ